MTKLRKISLSKFNGPITNTKKEKDVSYDELVGYIQYPKDEQVIKDYFETLRTVSSREHKSKLKSALPFVTPCVQMNETGRSQSDIVSFTGIMVLDFDHTRSGIHPWRKHEDYRNKLWNIKSVMGYFDSPSGDGVKAFVSIPVVKSVEEFKLYFKGFCDTLSDDLREHCDTTASNPALPMFLSYDSDAFFRNDYETFTRKAEPFKAPEVVTDNVKRDNDLNRRRVNAIIRKQFEEINNTQIGYTHLRKASLMGGNFVAGNYYSRSEMVHLLNEHLNSNHYLSKDKSKIYKYENVIEWGIDAGMHSPKILSSNERV